MRILHITPFLWSGAGSVITRLCLSQQRHHEVAVVTSGRSKGFTDWAAYRRSLAAADIRVWQADLFDREPAVFWRSVDRLAKYVEQLRPDVMHVHAGVPACAAAIVRQRLAAATRIIAHMYSWGRDRPHWMNAMDLHGFAAADRVVCSARSYQRQLVAAGIPQSRIAYVPWGLPLERLQPAASRRRVPRTDPHIGFVGRIEPRKGQLRLVEAFSRYRVHAPGARLELVGPVADAAYGREIERCIRASRLEDSVRRPGLVRSIAPRVARWDLFVSLSEDEGQGLAVLEAMALGVPVLARSVAGIEDYLRDGVTGFVLESMTASDVANAIGTAWVSPKTLRTVAARAARMVEQRYAWDTTLDRIEGVYAAAAA